MQSGCVLNPWALATREQMHRRSLSLVDKVGCGERSDIVACLQSKRAEDIQVICKSSTPNASRLQNAADAITNNEMRFMEFPFVPVDDDGNFFTKPVADLLKDQDAISNVKHVISAYENNSNRR